MKPTLMVLAAGMGSRYGGLKQIDPVGPAGESILDYSVYDAVRAGFERIVFVIRRDIEEAFRTMVGGRFEGRVPVDYVFQELDHLPDGFSVPAGRTKPWGTAHAVWTGAETIDAPFAVINADDFYGAASYQTLAGFLAHAQDGESAHYGMVGFTLRNTLSEHGHVARGICACDEQGYLQRIMERTKILKRGDAAVYLDADNQEHPLTGDELVSMNMWGFTPSFFVHLRDQFVSFLETQGDDPKAECYIPSAVDRLIADGAADVRMLHTSAAWFGVTYREDKPSVEAHIRRLVDDGVYPSALWQD